MADRALLRRVHGLSFFNGALSERRRTDKGECDNKSKNSTHGRAPNKMRFTGRRHFNNCAAKELTSGGDQFTMDCRECSATPRRGEG
jgi:hypothetical protein